jgi:hypothetical protein
MNNNLNGQNGQNIRDNADATEVTKDNFSDERSVNSQIKEKDSFVKLAMRNMVKKGSTSLFHFFLTIVGVIGTLLGLAIAFH